ncbi:unnamed protein product [Ectocarpus fasciculatus]
MGDQYYVDEYDEEPDMDELKDYMSPDEGDGDLAGFERPELNVDLSTAVVVSNLPQVVEAKHEKLGGVVKKVFSRMGTIADDGLTHPFDKTTGLTKGFAFVNFLNPQDAKQAAATLNGWQLDKSHLIKVYPFEQLARLRSLPEEYESPEPKPFKPRVDPSSWLADEQHRDQFVLRYSEPHPSGKLVHEAEVMWSEKLQTPSLCYGGEREKEAGKAWCELFLMWSPQGTYLTTFHVPGIALWGGERFEKQGRFPHKDVKVVEFSPCETYVMTCNFEQGDKAIIVWEVLTGQMLRAFPMATTAAADGAASLFRWSADGKYLARKGKDLISIYELPSMRLLDKKSLKAEGVSDFEWSPKDNVLAYWAPEQANAPARVSVVEIPSRKELRQKNLVMVSECRLHWQDEGDYLCVKVLRHSKSKKTMYNNFEIFRVREPLVPVETMEKKQQVAAFAWEPAGDRFALVLGDVPKLEVTFYTMKGGAGKNELQELETLQDRPFNHIYWSPMGNICLLAAMGDDVGPHNGRLEFYDVENQSTLKQTEHFRCNYIEWDPSGRYACTAVSQPVTGSHWKAQMDNGYQLFSFQGERFNEFKKDNFYQIQWRPRPASLLTSAEKKKVVKNLRKYEKRFEKDDREKDRRKAREAMSDKIQMKLEFRQQASGSSCVAEMKLRLEGRRQELLDLRNGYDSDDESHYVVDSRTGEVVLSVKEVIQ